MLVSHLYQCVPTFLHLFSFFQRLQSARDSQADPHYYCFLLQHSTMKRLQFYMITLDVHSAFFISVVTVYRFIQEASIAHHVPGSGRGTDAHSGPGRSVRILSLVWMSRLKLAEVMALPQAARPVYEESRLNSGQLPIKSPLHSLQATPVYSWK